MAEDDSVSQLEEEYPSEAPHGGNIHKGGKTRKPFTEPFKPAQSADDLGLFGGKRYKFEAVTDPTGEVEDYTSQGPTGELPKEFQGKAFQKYDTGEVADLAMEGKDDPHKLTDSEYDALTKEASKGNKLAQEILVRGHYKAHDFPTLTQDMNKLEDPFVKALSGMPALATNLENQQNSTTQLYDFTNAEGQVNNILGGMGSSMRATPDQTTTNYVNKLQGFVNQGANQINQPGPNGVPSIMQALEGLGPAAKLSEKSTPTEALLGALLSHLQYETIYGGQTPSGKGEPNWLQQLLASVTGLTAGGNLVSPLVAASGLAGTTPSTGASTIPNT